MKFFIKAMICFFAVMVFVFSFDITAEAAVGGSCGSGVNWSYENGTLRIYGNGRMNDMSRSSQPWKSYKDSISNVIIEEGITYIGAEAFYEIASIKTVSLPDTLKGIGYAAFCWCEGLERIDIPGSVETIGENAFWCCLDLTEVNFSEGLIEIKDEAFTFCRLLTSLSFPQSLETIGYWAFGDCSDLESVYMPGVKNIGESCFSGCSSLRLVKLGEGLFNIKTSTFAYCYSLGSITIPGSVEYIGDTAFYLCENIGTVTFKGTVPEISEIAFAGASAVIRYPSCNTEWENVSGETFGGSISYRSYGVEGHDYSQTTVEPTCLHWGYTVNSCVDCSEYYMDNYIYALGHAWDSGVTSGSKTTYTCTRCKTQRYEYSVSGTCGSNAYWTLDTEKGILNITGTGGITNKSGYAKYKDSIKSVVINYGITSIGAEAFFEFENIESISIPETVKSIGESAFVWCRNLKELVIPEGVTRINESTFWGCEYLEKLVLPSTLEYIATESFYYCKHLKKLEIPDSVTTIEELAFWYCQGLEEVNIPKGVTELAEDTFSSCTKLKKVTFHDKLEVIGIDAFSGCSSLENIDIPESVHTIKDTAFWGCSSLKEVVIPGSVMNFGHMVFGNCSNLRSIKFTGNPPVFSETAFKNFSTTVLYRAGNSAWTSSVRKQYGGSVTWKNYYVDGHIFSYEVKEPSCTCWGYTKYSCIDCNEYYMDNYRDPVGHEWELTETTYSYMKYRCVRCDEIKMVYTVNGYCGSNVRWSLNTEEGILKIYGTGSMNNMGRNSQPWSGYKDSIKQVIIESGVSSIGSYAFYEHPVLEYVEIPSTVKSIGLGAFCWSQQLKEITIPEGVTSIPEDCFWACSSLKVINLPSTIKTIGQGAFYYTAIKSIYLADGITDIGEDAFWYCTYLESVTIPKSLKILRETIFSSCSKLKSVTLHDGITEIQRSAFSHCGALTSVTLPKNLKIIGESAFSNTAISKITIPENVTSIDGYVFGGSLKEIHFLGNAPQFDAKTFNGITVTAYYPENSASWSSNVRTNYGGKITWISEACMHLICSYEVFEPDCEQGGYRMCSCLVCGMVYADSYVEPMGHSFCEWYIVKEPAVGEKGEERRDCEKCGYYEVKEIPALCEYGDVNGDGKINVIDASVVRKAAAKVIVLDENQIAAADVNGDGKVNVIDASLIRKYAAKVISVFPVEE